MRTSFDNTAQHIMLHLTKRTKEKKRTKTPTGTKDSTEASDVQLMSIKLTA